MALTLAKPLERLRSPGDPHLARTRAPWAGEEAIENPGGDVLGDVTHKSEQILPNTPSGKRGLFCAYAGSKGGKMTCLG